MAPQQGLTTWERLAHYVGEERRDKLPLDIAEVQRSIIRRLLALAKLGLCERRVVGWFTTEDGRLRISDAAPDLVGTRRAIRFRELRHLDDALLTLIVTCRGNRIQGYSIQLAGKTRRAEPRDWYARVDLTPEPCGVGLCSHALLHAHVGGSTSEDDLPSDGKKW